MNTLTEDFTYIRPLFLLLQDESKFRADADVANVVQQNPDHTPGQMHEAAETHEFTELRGRWIYWRLLMFSLFIKVFCLSKPFPARNNVHSLLTTCISDDNKDRNWIYNDKNH